MKMLNMQLDKRLFLSWWMGYKNKNRIVTCDNAFFNLILFCDILKVGVPATNICRTDQKGWPSALTIDQKKWSRGQLWYRMDALSKLVAISWFDNKLISNILFIIFSPIDHARAKFATHWHSCSFKNPY